MRWEIVCQVLVNSLVSGCRHGLVALGFGIVYRTCKFLPVCLSVSYVAAAYVTYTLIPLAPLPLAIFLGIALGSTIAVSFEVGIFRALAKRAAPPESCLVAALGLSAIGTATTALVFGRGTLVYDLAAVRGRVALGPVTMTGAQILAVGAAVLCVVVVGKAMRTSQGLYLRAAGEAPDLALAYGMDLGRTRLVAVALGAGVIGLAGILDGADTDMRPMMGFHALLYGLVAAVLAGPAGVASYMIAGLLVGLLQNIGGWLLPAQWQDGVVFLLLFGTLVLRPEGLLERPGDH